MSQPDYAVEVRNALLDASRLADGLGIGKGGKRQASGVMVCCPVHNERNPSMSITTGPDGTLRVRCFGCDWAGDALALIGAVRGLNFRIADEFREALAEGASIAGDLSLEAEIRDGKPRPDRKPVPLPPREPDRDYPPELEVRKLWCGAKPVTDDREASGYLVRRRIDPELVEARRLARVIDQDVPDWARHWVTTGHRMIVRMFDASGVMRSVRAWRVRDGDCPKRLPPAKYRAAELVMANLSGFQLLKRASPAAVSRVLIAEGEPDMLTLATVQPEEVPVLGIVNGSWSDDFADAIPTGADVVIYTDPDPQGERYAQKISASVGDKCRAWRAA